MKSEAPISKEKRVQKTIYFDPEVWQALDQHMKRERINNLSIGTNDALRYALFPEYRDDRNEAVLKQLYSLTASLVDHRKKTGRDLAILQEFTLQLMKQFFVHTNPIPSSEKASAEAQANARLDNVMETVMRSISKVSNLN